MKGAYHDFSKVADFLSRTSIDAIQNRSSNFGVKMLGYGIEAALPFKKTPINVLKRGIEYSPIGLMSTIGKAMYQAVDMNRQAKLAERNGYTAEIVNEGGNEVLYVTDDKGNRSAVSKQALATQFIDDLSCGIAGSAVFAIGMMLAKSGIIRLSDDDDKEEEWQKAQGYQNYSINVGGFNLNIDWVAPTAMPLLIGAEFAKVIEGEGINFGSAIDAMSTITQPYFDLSMMDGMNNLLSNLQNSENPAATFAVSLAYNYLSSFLPTAVGQLARTIDPVRRTTFNDKNAPLSGNLQYYWQKLAMKVPFLSKNLPAYQDALGNETNYADEFGWFGNAVYQFISPAYMNKIREQGVVEQGIESVVKANGDTSLYPTKKQKYMSYKGVKYNFTASQYTAFTDHVGTKTKELVEKVQSLPGYSVLDDYYKAKVLEDIYSYAAYSAKDEFLSANLRGYKTGDCTGANWMLDEYDDIADAIV